MKAYKYRFYPTEEQRLILAKTFGCVRYVYNWGLHLKDVAYHDQGVRLYYKDLASTLTLLKRQKETIWLNEVSSVVLQQSLRHLDRAFINFFEGRAEYPTFHKKTFAQSATYASNAFKWDGENLTLAKMNEPLNIRWTPGKKNAQGKRERYVFKGVPTTVTIRKDCANRYFVSFQVFEEITPLLSVDSEVGIDFGLMDAVILSTGRKFGNPKFFKKDEKRLTRAQKTLSKKQKDSKNRVKAKLKVARIHARITDRRNDFLHKLTTTIVHENQVIALESLQVKNMIQNHHLAKSIADVSWGELVRQLSYKCEWNNRTFVQIDKFYPSSKRCSTVGCGYHMKKMPLHVRTWVCPACGSTHDRDINAAKNILAAGLAVLACGEAVRPARKLRKPRAGKSSVKQEA